MSSLGKIFLYAALVGALVAVVYGVLLNLDYDQAKKDRDSAQIAKKNADEATTKAKQETADAKAAKADADKQLADATSKITDLNTQLDTANKQAATAGAALQTANDTAKAAQDKLDAINKTLNGETPEQYVADKNKAESDLAAAQSEQKIIQDQLQASQQQVATLQDALKRSGPGTMPPGISGKVTFVDHPWNFVILDVGLSNGVVPNGELIVYRGNSFLGKIRVTKADPNDSVAEILPDIKGDIEVGDKVLN